jgi:Flp pilus assembly protein TadD
VHALGSDLDQQGKLIEARQYLHLALKLHPGHPVILTTLASIYRKMGQLPEAEACLERAVQNPVPFPRAYSDLGLLKLSLGKTSDAIRYLEIARRLTPHDQRIIAVLRNVGGGPTKGDAPRRSP